MKLFNRDVDFVKRILNLILVIWLVTAIAFTYTAVVNIVFNDKLDEYERYEYKYCFEITDEECEKQYRLQKFTTEERMLGNKKQLYNSIGNVIIIGAFLLIINKDKKV